MSGMGVVYRAWDPGLECIVAIKLVSEDTIPDESARRQLYTEARIVSSLSHHDLLWLVPLHWRDQLFLQVDSLSFHLVQKSPVRPKRGAMCGFRTRVELGRHSGSNPRKLIILLDHSRVTGKPETTALGECH